MDLVSIIIPAYNAQEWVVSALASAVSQTHENIEIVLIDDASTDNTERIAKSFLEEHECSYQYIRCETNSGVCACSCLLYTSPSPRDKRQSRMPSSA